MVRSPGDGGVPSTHPSGDPCHPMHEAPRETATAAVLCGAGSAQHRGVCNGRRWLDTQVMYKMEEKLLVLSANFQTQAVRPRQLCRMG